jgi:23S rRNA (cytosine1962-C5)-methyltransferase
MFATDQYQLLDFGAGRKLERFGAYVLDRPAPAAGDAAPRDVAMWLQADARYERREGEHGRWAVARPMARTWLVHCESLALELKLTESGQVGIFPEQADNLNWISRQARAAGRPIKVVNLFAYTGAGTLAAAAAGAEVTHVDAAASAVSWARRNADRSGLTNAPIRWIVDDAMTFARRELRRGHRYDAAIIDPPAYGHGPRGQTWKLAENLGELLAICAELTARNRQFMLLSCHSGPWGFASELLKYTISQQPVLRDEGTMGGSDMSLVSLRGERLHLGAAVRWSAAAPSTSPRRAGERNADRPSGQR